jgi:tetratricopeptide (TPR) repeat protein
MQSRTFIWFFANSLLAAVLVTFCGPAAADDRETCKSESGDAAITACTRAIASKKYKAPILSLLYTNRGAEYGAKGDTDRAIADHDQAIKLDPKNALAFNNRGIVKLKKGDKEGGNADLERAKLLQPGIGQPPKTNDDDATVVNARQSHTSE